MAHKKKEHMKKDVKMEKEVEKKVVMPMKKAKDKKK